MSNHIEDFYAAVDHEINDMPFNDMETLREFKADPWTILDHEEAIEEIAESMGWTYCAIVSDVLNNMVEYTGGDAERAVEFVRQEAFEGRCDGEHDARMNPFSHWD